MARTLIIYGTRRGTTETTVAVIAETLILRHGHQVEIANIRNIRRYRRRLNEFDNFIVGSSIVRGRWIRRVLRFLIRGDFEGRKVALFVTAGNTKDKVIKLGIKKDQAREEAIEKYINPNLEKFKFTPIDVTAFGGMVVRSGMKKNNSWSREDIESWASRVGKICKGEESKP